MHNLNWSTIWSFRDVIRTSARRQGRPAPARREEAELGDLRSRLKVGLHQARAGDLADGSGEDAIRRAFAAARERS